MLEVEGVERAVAADVAGGQEQGVDAELVHPRHHRRGFGEAVLLVAAHLHCDPGGRDRAVPDRAAVRCERVAQDVDDAVSGHRGSA